MKIFSRDAVQVFKALSDVTRVEIIQLVGEAPRNVTELTSLVGVSQPKVSRHLKILRDAGLLMDVRKGKWVWYQLALERKGEPAGAAISAMASLFSGKELPTSGVRQRNGKSETGTPGRRAASEAAARGLRAAYGEASTHRTERGPERAGRLAPSAEAGRGTVPGIIAASHAARLAQSERKAKSSEKPVHTAEPGVAKSIKRKRSRRAGAPVERESLRKNDLEDFLL